MIATCYASSPVAHQELPLFHWMEGGGSPAGKKPYKVEITEVSDYTGDGCVDLADVEWLIKNKKNVLSVLEGDGDFRSEECIELLKEADIVVTNPPFSLFREYVAQLMEYDKKFLIIGNQNAITYKEIFPLIKENKMWLGYGFKRGDSHFLIPKENAREFAPGVYDPSTGLVHFRNVTWFTNLDHSKRHEELFLYKTYTPEDYPKYDNYDAINVNKTSDIPCDYDGAIGVPITFLDKYNPEQFEIIDANNYRQNEKVPMKKHGLIKDKDAAIYGKPTYVRILIRKRQNSNQ